LKHRVVRLLGAAAAVMIGLSGCGSANTSSGQSSNGVGSTDVLAAGAPIKVGVITSLSGASKPSYITVEGAIKARFSQVNDTGGIDGHKIEYVMADDASSPQGVLSAARRLVEQEKVFGIVNASAYLYGASSYLLESGIPVTGPGNDGPEWGVKANVNLFQAFGNVDPEIIAATTYGAFFEAKGVTKLGIMSYQSPSAVGAANAVSRSAEVVGIPTVYINRNVPFGGTDVGTAVAAMKEAGVDGVFLPMQPASSFAVMVGLAQNGVTLKASALSTGYGRELLASQSAVEAAQGAFFPSYLAPVELNTPATKRFQDAMAKYAGVTGNPNFTEYATYVSAAAFLRGLEAAGPDISQRSFITNLRAVTSWDAEGLLTTSHPQNFGAVGTTQLGLGPDNCIWMVTLKGASFAPDSPEPVCGTAIPGSAQKAS
jgi:branched-chain amino acid transport system substrate-binding protein